MGEDTGKEQRPSGVDFLFLVQPCSTQNLSRVRDFVEKNVADLELDEMDVLRLMAAADEAAMNAVDHGGNLSSAMDFVVGLGRQRGCLIILVRDYGGKQFDPEYFESISRRKTWGLKGGRGILLMSRAMDEVMYLFSGARSTTVCMLKYLDNIADPPAEK